MEHILSRVERSISYDMNLMLTAKYTKEEVYATFKDMGPTKVSGVDGFSALFFQRCWHIVGGDIVSYSLGILNEGKEIDSTNITNAVLIPKVSHLTNIENFRPISLCNVLYKVVKNDS